MNQQQNAISLARVLASTLVRVSQAWNFVKHRLGWKSGFQHQHYIYLEKLLWLLPIAIFILSSDVLAKREGPTDIRFEVRFLRTIALAFPIHLFGIFITKMINSKFYQNSRFRFMKYVVSSSIVCSLLTATDNLNDESWNPGTGVFVYLVFSFSFIAFRMYSTKGLLWAVAAALATFLILIIPFYITGILVQQIIRNAGINIAW